MSKSEETAVEVKDLRKTFPAGIGFRPVEAVAGISFRIRSGEVFGLIGPNGSGKSTTIKILLGLIGADSGTAVVLGKTPRESESRRRVGFLPEAPYFYQHLTARELLRFLGQLSGMSGEEIDQRIEPTLELVGLQSAADRPTRTYSKGMLQRVGLAQSLIHDPDLLILDEPTAGVDPLGAAEIARIVRECKDRGKTVLLCSHLLSQVELVCDRIHMLHRGRTLLEGRMEELITVPDEVSIVVRPEGGNEQAIREKATRAGLSPLRMEKPRRSLESLFIEEVQRAEKTQSRKS